MSEMEPPGTSPPRQCAQCETWIENPSDGVETDGGIFCLACFAALEQELRQFQRGQTEDINYAPAAVGAVLAGALGAVIWWGFTVLTRISFGLVAVVIGYLVGHGVVRFSGGKRSRGLQGLAVAVSAVAYFYATYLVNRTFILRALEEQGDPSAGLISIPIVPDLSQLVEIVRLGFGIFDLVFLAIVVYQAWSIPAPIRILRERGQ